MRIILIAALFTPLAAFGDSAQVVCSMGDYSNVAEAAANLNGKLKKIAVKSASAPIFSTDSLGFVTTCLTVTQ
ncbi:MAG: hypothetical protein ACXVBE_18285 [Bdellovibrionota bacterium]